MENFLTVPEIKALNELKHVDHDSIWGVAIKNTLKQNNPVVFRQLISDLLSQNNDCPPVMQNILGSAYSSVVGLKN